MKRFEQSAYDDSLSADDLATRGVGLIGAALHRAKINNGSTEAVRLGKSIIIAIQNAQLAMMESVDWQRERIGLSRQQDNELVEALNRAFSGDTGDSL